MAFFRTVLILAKTIYSFFEALGDQWKQSDRTVRGRLIGTYTEFRDYDDFCNFPRREVSEFEAPVEKNCRKSDALGWKLLVSPSCY